MQAQKTLTSSMFFLLKLIFSSAALWWVLRQINTDHLIATLSEIPLSLHFYTFLVMCVSVCINSARLYFITQKLNMKDSFRYINELTWIGTFFNQLLPSGIGGDAYRIYGLSKENTTFISLCAVVWDRILGISCMSIVCIPMLFFIPMPPALKTITLAAYTILIGAILSILIFIRYPVLIKFKIMKGLWDTLAAGKILGCKPRTKFLTINIFSAFLNFFSFYLIVIALNIPLNFWESSVLFTISLLVTLIPLSISGWGLRESFLTAYLFACGLPPEKGFSLGILQGIQILGTGIIGAIFYLFCKKSKKSLANPIKMDSI